MNLMSQYALRRIDDPASAFGLKGRLASKVCFRHCTSRQPLQETCGMPIYDGHLLPLSLRHDAREQHT